jgi:hypothetical protein
MTRLLCDETAKWRGLYAQREGECKKIVDEDNTLKNQEVEFHLDELKS